MPLVALWSAVVATMLLVSGCGDSSGGGGSGTSTPPPDPGCSDKQGKCTSCKGGKCLGCPAQYVLENSTDGGFCIAECLKNGYVPKKPPAPPNVFGLNGVAWPEMCINKTTAHFFGIGDWGGDAVPGQSWPNPGVTRPKTDEDKWSMKYVARNMKMVAKSADPDYVINVGDNFYPGGVNMHCGAGAEAAGLNDPTGQFKRFHDDYYSGPGLDGKPWLSVLGNHDYGGTGFVQGWDVQVYRTWAPNDLWVMPGQYWSQRMQYSDFSVEFFFLDSNHQDAHSKPGHNICQFGDKCWGITNDTCVEWLDQAWAKSKEMLKAGLKKSTADWRVVVTHFPGPTITGDPAIRALKDDIDLVITGHTHYQQIGADKGLKWIITGGGGGITSDGGTPSKTGYDMCYGFVDFTISRTELKYDMHSWGGPDPGKIIIMKTDSVQTKNRPARQQDQEITV